MSILTAPEAAPQTDPGPRPAPADASLARLRLCCRLAALFLGIFQAYCARHYMNADGISYLDIGDAYVRGDWQAAVSSYWSPLYSWLVAGALALLQPSAYWEFAAVKLVNLVIYLGSLLAFEWLLSELLLLRRARPAAPGESVLPDWAVLLFGYALFLSGALVLIWVGLVSPDMCVALFVYLLAALLTRGRRLGWRPGSSVLLGVLLGVAYLAKTAMLPLGPVFLAASALAASGWKKALAHLALSGALWAAIAGGYVMLISAKAGRFAFGDSSTLNYLWWVNGVELFRWRTDDPSLGRLLHPPRELFASPPVYEFAAPISGTYPLWYYPPYWLAGLTPRFELGRQMAAVGNTTLSLLKILFTEMAVFTVGTAVLYGLAWSTFAGTGRRRRTLGALGEQYQLLLPALAALGMYGLVYLEARYLAPFLVLFFLGLVCGVRWASGADAYVCRRLRLLVVLALLPVAVLLPALAGQSLLEALGGEGGQVHQHWAVAQRLAAGGAAPGERVGVIGDAFECGWARLARLRITAQVLEGSDAERYWSAEAARQQEVLEAFRRAGVTAVVAPRAPDPGAPWVRVHDTNFYVLFLTPGTVQPLAD